LILAAVRDPVLPMENRGGTEKNGFPPDNQEPRHWRSKPEPGGVSPGESADGLTHP